MEAFMLFDYQGNSLKSGVYKLTNLSNNRIYIGSAKGFKQRWYKHHYALKNNKHSNRFLQADYNKCGEYFFKFEFTEHYVFTTFLCVLAYSSIRVLTSPHTLLTTSY
jgi:group I intron endonuclease